MFLAVALLGLHIAALKLHELHSKAEFPARFAHSSLLQVQCKTPSELPEINLHVTRGYVMADGSPQW